MRGPVNPDAVEKNALKTDAAANTAAVITIAAVSDEFWVLDSIHCSYDTVTAGKLTVEVPSGTTLWEVDIMAAGPQEFLFPRGLYDPTDNQAMVITLAAGGGAGDNGKVNCTYR